MAIVPADDKVPENGACKDYEFLENGQCFDCLERFPGSETCGPNSIWTCMDGMVFSDDFTCIVAPEAPVVTTCEISQFLEDGRCIDCSSIFPNSQTCDANKIFKCKKGFTGSNCDVCEEGYGTFQG